MYGKLDEALKTLLTQSLPTLFGGDQPPVKLATAGDIFELDAHSAEAATSEPRPDDRTDNFPFDPTKPAGPYALSQPPVPGPRRVRLLTPLKDRIPLRDDEVVWDKNESRLFTLALRPERDPSSFNGVQVLYSITAVYLKLKVAQNFSIELQSTSEAQVDKAESLAVGVIALNRQKLIDEGGSSFQDGDYGVEISVKSFQLVTGAVAPKKRTLNFRAEIELKAMRALADDEGKPIKRIRTSSRPVDPLRPVDIHIDVEA
ncbi:MAG TPA: hypothetical protein VF666_10385 [Pyrinomonadaceae bacterium]|jgi:hypothetical protein